MPEFEGLGTLDIIECYLYYDLPLLSLVRASKTNQLFLCTTVEATEGPTWVHSPVTPRTIQLVQENRISWAQACLTARNSFVVVQCPSDPKHPFTGTWQSTSLGKEHFPTEACFKPSTVSKQESLVTEIKEKLVIETPPGDPAYVLSALGTMQTSANLTPDEREWLEQANILITAQREWIEKQKAAVKELEEEAQHYWDTSIKEQHHIWWTLREALFGYTDTKAEGDLESLIAGMPQEWAMVQEAVKRIKDSKTLDGFQSICAETANYPEAGTGSKDALTYTVLGLNGEAGELADHWKKCLRGDHGDPGDFTEGKKKLMISELGDVMWYLARCAQEFGVQLSAVAQSNINKLRDRRERGVIKGSGDER